MLHHCYYFVIIHPADRIIGAKSESPAKGRRLTRGFQRCLSVFPLSSGESFVFPWTLDVQTTSVMEDDWRHGGPAGWERVSRARAKGGRRHIYSSCFSQGVWQRTPASPMFALG